MGAIVRSNPKCVAYKSKFSGAFVLNILFILCVQKENPKKQGRFVVATQEFLSTEIVFSLLLLKCRLFELCACRSFYFWWFQIRCGFTVIENKMKISK